MSHDTQEVTPDIWMQHMRRGAFEEAWKHSDLVLRSRAGAPCWHLPRHLQYIWNGKSLEGKRVLVRCYHGLGDTIQFIRYAPLLKAIAAKVIVWAQPPLLPLLETTAGIDELLPLHDGSPDAEYDIDVEVMEMPHIFRTTLPTIPTKIPYLHVEPKPLASDKKQLAVGLVWKAGDWDSRRSIPFSLLSPLAQVQGIKLYILQADAAAAGWQEGTGIHPGKFNLAEYARVVRGLDLLITVDSMPAHLAGALGVPVWTLLHAEADWRWMENRDDSPWYPTMRLFRQEQLDEWEPVIERITAELKQLSNV
ncbi:glycosyltransferase family 9 protein [Pontibacter ruber]|uniref:Glycosyltransferase family 9 protein n=1 Tax=Pontibacter ruber TaxID=1343895 RepID=A0ABW5CTT4_9BACT|nr:glycosyltransferase family 9 protein [Pontibacter ruber]